MNHIKNYYAFLALFDCRDLYDIYNSSSFSISKDRETARKRYHSMKKEKERTKLATKILASKERQLPKDATKSEHYRAYMRTKNNMRKIHE